MVLYNTLHSIQTYLVYKGIPTPLHHGAPTGLGGGPDTLPVPVAHSVRGPQCQHTIP